MKKSSFAKIIIGIFTVLLTISLIFFIVFGIQRIKNTRNNTSYYTEEVYISDLERGDYMELLNMANRDSKFDDSESNTIKECKAVAKYFESATLYKAYLVIADTASARIQIQRMEQAAAQTGQFQEHVEKINALLELDKIGQ